MAEADDWLENQFPDEETDLSWVDSWWLGFWKAYPRISSRFMGENKQWYRAAFILFFTVVNIAICRMFGWL